MIESLGSDTDKLMELRPVSLHLKSNPDGAVQYGLISEEIDEVYPEPVIRDGSGKMQGVRYEESVESDGHAQQISRLKEMIIDARKASEVVGFQFSPIVNHPLSWTV